MCVHPWTKGFVQLIHRSPFPPVIHTQGRPTDPPITFSTRESHAGGDRVAAWLSPTKLHAVDQDAGTDHPRVPALLTVDHAVQSPFFVSMVVHDTSPKPFSLRLAAAERRFHLSAFGNIVQQYLFADSCTFPFLHLPSQRGN